MNVTGCRGDRMAGRLARELERAGVRAEGVRLVVEAHHLAMEYRRRILEDEKHPGFLHPGRTALVLLRDAGERDPTCLAAGASVDTWWHRAEPSDEEVSAGVGPDVARLRAEVPRPGEDPGSSDWDALTEALVLAEPEIRRLALAERLDHLRHLHLLGPGDGINPNRTAAEHHMASTVYLPLAARTHRTLERRYRHWCRVFGRAHQGWNPADGEG